MADQIGEALMRIAGLLDEALSIADAIDRPLLAALIAHAADVIQRSESS